MWRKPSSNQELATNWSWEGWSAPGDHIYHRRAKIKTACSFNCLLKSELSLPHLRPQDSALVKITGRMSLDDYERVPVLFSEVPQMALIVAYATNFWTTVYSKDTVHNGPEVLFITFIYFLTQCWYDWDKKKYSRILFCFAHSWSDSAILLLCELDWKNSANNNK